LGPEVATAAIRAADVLDGFSLLFSFGGVSRGKKTMIDAVDVQLERLG
jgi:hypothetical protein